MVLLSRKVLSVLIIVASIVTAIIIAFGQDKSSKVINFANNLVVGDKIKIAENPNWQAELQKIPSTGLLESASSTETITDTVSRTLITNYLALKQSGNLDGESAKKLVDQTVDYLQKNNTSNKITKLNIVEDNSLSSMAAYGHNLGEIAKRKSVEQMSEDFNLILQAVQTESVGSSVLDEIILNYKEIVVDLQNMSVPKTFAKAHLDITNSVNGMASALVELKKSSNDPFRGLTALQAYQQNMTLVYQAVIAVANFLKQNGLSYEQDSGGYYLIHGI